MISSIMSLSVPILSSRQMSQKSNHFLETEEGLGQVCVLPMSLVYSIPISFCGRPRGLDRHLGSERRCPRSWSRMFGICNQTSAH